jgi:hypothetical protein
MTAAMVAAAALVVAGVLMLAGGGSIAFREWGEADREAKIVQAINETLLQENVTLKVRTLEMERLLVSSRKYLEDMKAAHSSAPEREQ